MDDPLYLLRQKIIKTDAVLKLLADKKKENNILTCKLQALSTKYIAKDQENRLLESMLQEYRTQLQNNIMQLAKLPELKVQYDNLMEKYDSDLSNLQLKYQNVNLELQKCKDIKTENKIQIPSTKDNNSRQAKRILQLQNKIKHLQTTIEDKPPVCNCQLEMTKNNDKIANLKAIINRSKENEYESEKKIQKLNTVNEELRNKILGLQLENNMLLENVTATSRTKGTSLDVIEDKSNQEKEELKSKILGLQLENNMLIENFNADSKRKAISLNIIEDKLIRIDNINTVDIPKGKSLDVIDNSNINPLKTEILKEIFTEEFPLLNTSFDYMKSDDNEDTEPDVPPAKLSENTIKDENETCVNGKEIEEPKVTSFNIIEDKLIHIDNINTDDIPKGEALDVIDNSNVNPLKTVILKETFTEEFPLLNTSFDYIKSDDDEDIEPEVPLSKMTETTIKDENETCVNREEIEELKEISFDIIEDKLTDIDNINADDKLKEEYLDVIDNSNINPPKREILKEIFTEKIPLLNTSFNYIKSDDEEDIVLDIPLPINTEITIKNENETYVNRKEIEEITRVQESKIDLLYKKVEELQKREDHFVKVIENFTKNNEIHERKHKISENLFEDDNMSVCSEYVSKILKRHEKVEKIQEFNSESEDEATIRKILEDMTGLPSILNPIQDRNKVHLSKRLNTKLKYSKTHKYRKKRYNQRKANSSSDTEINTDKLVARKKTNSLHISFTTDNISDSESCLPHSTTESNYDTSEDYVKPTYITTIPSTKMYSNVIKSEDSGCIISDSSDSIDHIKSLTNSLNNTTEENQQRKCADHEAINNSFKEQLHTNNLNPVTKNILNYIKNTGQLTVIKVDSLNNVFSNFNTSINHSSGQKRKIIMDTDAINKKQKLNKENEEPKFKCEKDIETLQDICNSSETSTKTSIKAAEINGKPLEIIEKFAEVPEKAVEITGKLVEATKNVAEINERVIENNEKVLEFHEKIAEVAAKLESNENLCDSIENESELNINLALEQNEKITQCSCNNEKNWFQSMENSLANCDETLPIESSPYLCKNLIKEELQTGTIDNVICQKESDALQNEKYNAKDLFGSESDTDEEIINNEAIDTTKKRNTRNKTLQIIRKALKRTNGSIYNCPTNLLTSQRSIVNNNRTQQTKYPKFNRMSEKSIQKVKRFNEHNKKSETINESLEQQMLNQADELKEIQISDNVKETHFKRPVCFTRKLRENVSNNNIQTNDLAAEDPIKLLDTNTICSPTNNLEPPQLLAEFNKAYTPKEIDNSQNTANIKESNEPSLIYPTNIKPDNAFQITTKKKNVKPLVHSSALTFIKQLLNYSSDKKTVENIFEKFVHQKPQYTAKVILKIVASNVNEKPDTKYTPPAPVMTQTQRILQGFMNKLEKSGVNILETYLKLTEHYLLYEATVEQIDPLTRLYVAICKQLKQIKRIRLFCCDAVYLMDRFVQFLYTTISNWFEVIPMECNSADVPLVRVILQIILSKPIESIDVNLNNLKVLLNIHHGYPKEKFNESEFFQQLLTKYKNEPTDTNEFAILLLCKRSDPTSIHRQIINHVLPLIHDDQTNNIIKQAFTKLTSRIISQFDGVKHANILENISQNLRKT